MTCLSIALDWKDPNHERQCSGHLFENHVGLLHVLLFDQDSIFTLADGSSIWCHHGRNVHSRLGQSQHCHGVAFFHTVGVSITLPASKVVVMMP